MRVRFAIVASILLLAQLGVSLTAYAQSPKRTLGKIERFETQFDSLLAPDAQLEILPEIYELLSQLLRHLPQQPPQPQTVFAFELKLLRELGQSPDLAASKLHPGTRQILARLTELDWPALAHLQPSPAQRGEMQQFLHNFLLYHLGRIPAGRSAALGC